MAAAPPPRRSKFFPDDPHKRPIGYGGYRPGAGRPRGRTTVSHERRAPVDAAIPLHVSLRIAPGMPPLRRERTIRVIRDAIASAHRDGFRVVQFAVLADRVHLLVEAGDDQSLARGMQGLSIRLARRVNAVLDRTGPLFAERYHAHPLATPRAVRDALRYVLLAGGGVDAYSSAPWFTHWRDAPRADAALHKLMRTPSPVAPPQTTLLSSAWRRTAGPFGVDEPAGDPPDPLSD